MIIEGNHGILMHMFNTRDERKFLEICLTAFLLSFIISYYRTKENPKRVQFYFETKLAVLIKDTLGPIRLKFLLPGKLSFLLLYVRVGSASNLQKPFSGRKKWIRTAEKIQTISMLVKNDP